MSGIPSHWPTAMATCVVLALSSSTSFAQAPASGESLLLVASENGLTLLDRAGEVRDRLLAAPLEAMEPCWSPDGKSIAFASHETGNAQIYVLDVAAKKVRRLTHTDTVDRMPTWSPDSKRICYMAGEIGDICLMDADGGNVVKLTANPGNDADPFWSPRGDKIAFCSERDGHRGLRLYTMNIDGSNVQQLIDVDTNGWVFPGWSPDGDKIAFGLRSADQWNVQLAIVGARGAMSWEIIDDRPGLNSFPAWSPDGGSIAYVRLPSVAYERSGYGGELVVYDLQTKERESIASGLPLWNPRVHWKPLPREMVDE